MFSRPISSAISMRSRATLRRKRVNFFVFLPRVTFVSVRSLVHSFSAFLNSLRMFSMPSMVHSRYSSALSSSPANSACSEKVTTSRMLSLPAASSSPILSSSPTAIGDLAIAFCVLIWPRSIRLAMATSPSRVSKGTTPISRRYNRTGSLVFSSAPAERSNSRSSSDSSSSAAIVAACSISRSSESAT